MTIDTEQSQELLDYDTEQYFRSLERKISALGFKNLQIRKGKIVVDGKDYPLQKNQ
ncbi:hypothetical protein IJU97_03455 [bacterium]|nr:hypothetical protein [bacterium]